MSASLPPTEAGGPTAAPDDGIAATAAGDGKRELLSQLARWEVLLAVTLVVIIGAGAATSPFLLTAGNFTNLTSAVIEVSTMALPMALVIIVGEIDLSVESMVGLSCSLLGLLWAAGYPLWIDIPFVLVVGALGGLLNGLLVTRAALPSLVVTLGTLAVYRGLALGLLGPTAVSQFPPAFNAFGFGTIPGTPVPWTLLLFGALALILGVGLHATSFGRQIFATGKNARAAAYSGVRVARLKIGLFVLSGTVAALAGVILTARLASARADAGTGMTLTVVTIVLLGGVDIFGGSGSILGVVLAAATLAVLENALRLDGISSDVQGTVVGALLIISVSVPHIAHQFRVAVDRARAGRPPPPARSRPGEVVRSP
jgi:rhamnose transport system permease protein